MTIDWIIPCRYAEIHDNVATIVGAGIDTWWVADFPAVVQVLVAVRLLARQDELGPDHDHTTRNIISDAGGKVISDLSQTFKVGSPAQVQQAHPDWLNGIALTTLIQFEAAEEGTYGLEHIVDGSSKPVPLHVRLGPPPGFPGA